MSKRHECLKCDETGTVWTKDWVLSYQTFCTCPAGNALYEKEFPLRKEIVTKKQFKKPLRLSDHLK